MKRPRTSKKIVFVLFGATGDLALKKIFPALAALLEKGDLSPDSSIIAVGRRDWNEVSFKRFLTEQKTPHVSSIAKLISYSRVDIEAGTGYADLAEKVRRFGDDMPEAQIMVYFSLAPTLYAPAFTSLEREGIFKNGTKLLIEKPFGTDERSACELDRFLLESLGEEQIMRVDHYLGKDTIQAIMNLHESTPDFSLLLSRESLSSIRLRLWETKGIDGRGATYDGVGAFRDVGQNHLLEMLAVIASEDPSVGTWQNARAKVIRRLAPPTKTCELSRRGQYEGYRSEAGVGPASMTETAFEVETTLGSGKLRGVPLVLESGKSMPASEAFIEVIFKENTELPRRMVFELQPNAAIYIEYRSGERVEYEVPRVGDAYENIIRAATLGREREFVGREEIEALWSYADHVVACWGKVPLETYGTKTPFSIQ